MIKIENTVHPFVPVTTAHVTVGSNKTVEVRIFDLPREAVEALCDQFKHQMLELYDNGNKKMGVQR